MRAITYDQTGDADVLRLVDKPLTEPGPGEVRVRVHRSGVNPTDWKSRRGKSAGTAVSPAQVPNQDGSGVVDAVGQGVGAALLGLRVWIWEAAWQRPEGTAQEYAVVPADHVVTLPDQASFDLGAALGIPFMTAHLCLTATEGGPSRLGPGTLQGRTVLVAGGAGAVGNAAIQLARWSDATVLTTVSSPRKAQLAAAAGADHVLDYRTQDVEREIKGIAPDGVDTVVEVAAGTNGALDTAVLAPGGSVACYADEARPLSLELRPQMMLNARWQFVLVYAAPAARKARAVEDIAVAVLDGAVRIGDDAGLPVHHFALERAGAAHDAVQDATVGKVLIDVTE